MNRETANGASMLPSPQGFLDDLTAVGTPLTGIPGADFDHFATSARSLVAEFRNEVRPGSVRYAFSEMVIPEHIGDAQLFHIDFTVAGDQLAGEFMEEVLALVEDLDVGLSQPEFSLPAIMASFDLPAHPALEQFNPNFTLSEKARILDYDTVREGGEVLQANVYAYSFASAGYGFNVSLAGEHGEPLASLVLLDGQRLDFSFGDPVEDYRYAANLGAIKPAGGLELEPALRVGDAPEALLEAWEAGFDLLACLALLDTPEEVRVSLGKPVGYVLEGLGVDLGEGGTATLDSFDSVDEGELSGIGFAIYLVGDPSLLEKRIIEVATNVKLAEQSGFLSPTWVNPELIHSCFHHTSLQFKVFKRNQVRSHPTAEACGFSRSLSIKDRDLNAAINILNRATLGHSGSNASGDYPIGLSVKEEAHTL